jgi:hypothetical protein
MSLYYFCHPCQAVTKDQQNLARHLLVKHPFNPTDKKSQDDLLIQRQTFNNNPMEYSVEIDDDQYTLLYSKENSDVI